MVKGRRDGLQTPDWFFSGFWRHLRRTKLPWYPPRLWMALMGGALVFVSLAVPVGMLDPARPDRLVADMPVDPFVLFLLPPLLSGAAGLFAAAAVAALGLAIVIPTLLRRDDPAPVVVDEGDCTGCELCVLDCPYDALEMGGSANDGRGVAIVDPSTCVACGICIGSCAFDAISLPGAPPPAPGIRASDPDRRRLPDHGCGFGRGGDGPAGGDPA